MWVGGPGFILTIIALSMGAWVFTTWIRVKHGYPLDDGAGNTVEPNGANKAEIERLRQENARLTDQLENYADRLAVLERIVTDKGVLLADEIEALRDQRGSASSVPLEDRSKTK